MNFEKVASGKTIRCKIHCFEDGSVSVSGDDVDTWIFECTDDAFERAMTLVADAGYVQSENE